MALVLADRVKDTTATTGVGSFTLAGSPPTGFQSFSAGVGVGNTCYYQANLGSEWEVGLGTLSGATTLVRTLILASSNSGNAVSFSAGTKVIFVTAPASILAKSFEAVQRSWLGI